jgi:hypothetical protein
MLSDCWISARKSGVFQRPLQIIGDAQESAQQSLAVGGNAFVRQALLALAKALHLDLTRSARLRHTSAMFLPSELHFLEPALDDVLVPFLLLHLGTGCLLTLGTACLLLGIHLLPDGVAGLL